MSEKHKALIEKINSGAFSDFDAVTFDKGGLFVIVSGKDFQKLLSSKSPTLPDIERVVDNFSK